jgi:hypothetical protein
MSKYKKVTQITISNKGYELVEYSKGTKAWYLDGEFHREDGPAIVYFNGNKDWFLYGRSLDKDDFDSIEMVRSMQAYELFTIQELAKLKFNEKI